MPKNSLKPLNEAIINLHQPNPHSNINEYLIGGASEFRRRVALEEIIANKISYLSVREQNKIKKTHCFSDKKLADQILRKLSFNLTQDQENAYEEIFNDISCETPMLRLLQGDVGSGKTIVAALIASSIVADNKHVAILAPTTILANQHYQNSKKLPLSFLAGQESLLPSYPTYGRQHKDATLLRQMLMPLPTLTPIHHR